MTTTDELTKFINYVVTNMGVGVDRYTNPLLGLGDTTVAPITMAAPSPAEWWSIYMEDYIITRAAAIKESRKPKIHELQMKSIRDKIECRQSAIDILLKQSESIKSTQVDLERQYAHLETELRILKREQSDLVDELGDMYGSYVNNPNNYPELVDKH